MVEHRLIERVLAVVNNKIENNGLDPFLVESIVDFIMVYTDSTHHGKEEKILFSKLKNRSIGNKDMVLMNDLIEEHRQARMKAEEINGLNREFKKGNNDNLDKIRTALLWLISFYPLHIKKEDEIFFPETEKYLTAEEMNSMLEDFQEFDSRMIHEKYRNFYNTLIGQG